MAQEGVEVTIETLDTVFLPNGDVRVTWRIGGRIFIDDFREVGDDLRRVASREVKAVKMSDFYAEIGARFPQTP